MPLPPAAVGDGGSIIEATRAVIGSRLRLIEMQGCEKSKNSLRGSGKPSKQEPLPRKQKNIYSISIKIEGGKFQREHDEQKQERNQRTPSEGQENPQSKNLCRENKKNIRFQKI